MNNVFAGLDEVFACEIKPFKLSFRISGVFELSNMFGNYNYTAEQIFWNSDYRRIIIKTLNILTLIKEYINATLI